MQIVLFILQRKHLSGIRETQGSVISKIFYSIYLPTVLSTIFEFWELSYTNNLVISINCIVSRLKQFDKSILHAELFYIRYLDYLSNLTSEILCFSFTLLAVGRRKEQSFCTAHSFFKLSVLFAKGQKRFLEKLFWNSVFIIFCYFCSLIWPKWYIKFKCCWYALC